MKYFTSVLLIASAFATSSCSTSSPRAALPEHPVEAPDNYDVVLLPADDFSSDYAADLAKIVEKDTGLRIRAMLPLGTRDWQPYPGTIQYDPELMKNLALPVIKRLEMSYGGKLYIILTTRDINSADRNLRFVFAQHYQAQNVSVVSAARMAIGEHGAIAKTEIIQNRLRKMLLRTIGIQYYNLARSTDIREVMYSPLMGLDDLDAMGLVLNAKGRGPSVR